MAASCLIVLLLAGMGFFQSEQIRRPLAFLAVVAAVALPVLAVTPVFNTSLAVYEERWNAAAEAEGEGRGAVYGMTKRTVNDFTGILDVIPDTPPLGLGLGMGTNVAAVLMNNRAGFQLAESEWPRMIQECGPIYGLMVIIMRVSLTAYLFVSAWRAFRTDNNTLAWLLFAGSAPLMLYGQTGQPTSLGFMVFGAGLCLAAARNPTPVFQSNQAGAPLL